MARTAAVVGTATAVSKGVSGRMDKKQAPSETATSSEGGDMSTELERLVALKNSGTLTDKEFQAAKAKLLSS